MSLPRHSGPYSKTLQSLLHWTDWGTYSTHSAPHLLTSRGQHSNVVTRDKIKSAHACNCNSTTGRRAEPIPHRKLTIPWLISCMSLWYLCYQLNESRPVPRSSLFCLAHPEGRRSCKSMLIVSKWQPFLCKLHTSDLNVGDPPYNHRNTFRRWVAYRAFLLSLPCMSWCLML